MNSHSMCSFVSSFCQLSIMRVTFADSPKRDHTVFVFLSDLNGVMICPFIHSTGWFIFVFNLGLLLLMGAITYYYYENIYTCLLTNIYTYFTYQRAELMFMKYTSI